MAFDNQKRGVRNGHGNLNSTYQSSLINPPAPASIRRTLRMLTDRQLTSENSNRDNSERQV